jgi:septal ring factor EnvC (AmiA/AmiB activator)
LQEQKKQFQNAIAQEREEIKDLKVALREQAAQIQRMSAQIAVQNSITSSPSVATK